MQINVCTMKQTAKDLFAKSSAFVELSVCKSDSYVEFTKKALCNFASKKSMKN